MSASADQPQTDPTLARLDDQLEWYDRKSVDNQRWYKRLKIVTIVTAACLPLLATLPDSVVIGTSALAARQAITGLAGVLIVVAEGIQQLNQYQQNWIAYRSTAETLKHEKYLFLAGAYPYNVPQGDRMPLLAERIESLVSQEHAKWVTAHQPPKTGAQA